MTGNQIVNYDEQWAAQAQQYAAQHKLTGGTFLSTRGGVLSFGDDAMPGNQAAVIVLDSVMENTLYPDAYDPDQKAAPLCYAFGRDVTQMAPHESMQTDPSYFQPQSNDCLSCKFNQWGTADKGRGKACQNRVRLALIPAGYYQPKRGSRDMDLHLFDDAAHFQTADMAFLKLPVTSVREWNKYVNQVAGSFNRPPHGVITRVFLVPDTKSQYVVQFETLEQVSNELFATIMARHDQAQKTIIQGYQKPEEQAAAPQGAGSLRGLRSALRR